MIIEPPSVTVNQWDYSNTPYNELPDPNVACNEYPNPPWNTVQYDWHAEYPVCSPEWFAQHGAKNALKIGLQYGTRDLAEEQRTNLARYLETQKTHEEQGEMVTERKAKEKKPIQPHIAVLTDEYLYFYTEGTLIRRAVQVETIADIFQSGMDAKVHAVWILPQSELSGRATREWIEAPDSTWIRKNPQYEQSVNGLEMCTCVCGYKNRVMRASGETGREIVVMFPEWNDWALDAITEPITLLGAIAYLEDALGIPIKYKPNSYGRRLMIAYNEENTEKGWIQPINIHKAIPISLAYADCIWTLKLSAEEIEELKARGLIKVVAYDKNSQYTGACTSVKLGVGTPVHEQSPQFNVKNPLPGIWHCRIRGESIFDGKQLPHPTDGKTEGWFWTYTVQLLFDLGYTVEIEEAYIWHESHVLLRKWATTLWDARCQLNSKSPECNEARYKSKAARDSAFSAIKIVLNSSLGMLAHKKDLDALEAILLDPNSSDNDRKYAAQSLSWYRPDYYDLLRDRARSLMYRRMKKFFESNAVLLGIQTDCLYYAASTSDHDTAIPGMMDRADLLGGFKRKYKGVDFTLDELAEYFLDPRADIRRVNKYMTDKEGGLLCQS